MIAFLGCGAMNEALLGGLLAAGHPVTSMTATVRGAEHARALAARHGVRVLATEDDDGANRAAVEGAGLVILGVAPAATRALARDIAPALDSGAVVISVAAAVTIEQLERELPAGQAVIRALPNMPSRLGLGAISLTAGTRVTPDQMRRVGEMLAPLGLVVEVPEEQVDAVSALSGSGPGYVFHLVQALAAAGMELGLEPETAARLARQTLIGAGGLLAEQEVSLDELLAPFAGPETMTSRALDRFDQRGLPGIIAEGVRAAFDRSRAVAEGAATD